MRLPLASLLALIVSAPALAKPTHQQALIRFFGPHLPEKLHVCTACHLRGEDEELGDGARKAHNPFGQRLAALRRQLDAAKKPSDIPARLTLVLEQDADGDGTSNLLELLAGTSPGDRRQQPEADALITARTRVPAFERYRQRAGWDSLRPVIRPSVPADPDAWVRNPIDAFIRHAQRAENLKPRPEADRHTLLRRVTLDLTGLPPTAAEIQNFVADRSPDAYERAVDRLLGTTAHAERWARHWMDVWRYSDWAGWGQQVRVSQKHIWRWRDWIVDSLAADVPYDEMVRQMLAADELYPLDDAKLRATGFLARNYNLLSREVWMQDAVDHTFSAFQAATVGCARCHDHMYDPISQEEYYRLRAVFAPHQTRTDRVLGAATVEQDGLPRVFDAKPGEVTKVLHRGDDRQPVGEPLLPGAIAAFGVPFVEPKPVTLPPLAVRPQSRPEFVRESIEAAQKASRAADLRLGQLAARRVAALLASRTLAAPGVELLAAHADKLARLDADTERLRGVVVAGQVALEQSAPEAAKFAQNRLDRQLSHLMARRARVAAESPALLRTNAEAFAKLAAAEEQARRSLDLPAKAEFVARVTTNYPATSTGRRSALAAWLTDARNPRTARVAVNHIWLRHFGEALAPSVADFGRNGRLPTHPELLDWLAAEFAENGHSMKKLHRLIVTSATYRQASTSDAAMAAIDRDNLFLWRFAPRRLEGEAVRDSLLAASGLLDAKIGGPDLDQNTALAVPRRSIYFRHAAEKQAEFLKLFDGPSTVECYERRRSVVPQQALAMFNSPLAWRAARKLARDLSAPTLTDGVYVGRLYVAALGRPATAEEERLSLEHLRTLRAALPSVSLSGVPGLDAGHPDPDIRARESLAHALMNHHEFVTIR